ncbi:hypothetical protein AVEN_219402-1 [Araneus ventricosus]|uniref:Uncharacterized protein n=1 Tax=Araneus ventricosus TaxID=182803 RepID=A0A4Y2MIC9_ARAVE|nr:hypothetical protein AVEN_219402-1 [Araneus ventricosus]
MLFGKCELHSVIHFLQPEGWFVENDQCSHFLSDLKTTAKSILTSGVVFVHDKGHLHSAVLTQQCVGTCPLNGTCLITQCIAPTLRRVIFISSLN